MRKLIYYVSVSLDGYIAGPGGEVDSFVYEGDHAPWLRENYPETMPGHLRETLGVAGVAPRCFDTVVLGRATHQIAVDAGLASGYPHLRQYVVTRHDDLPPEEGLTVTDDAPAELARSLKRDGPGTGGEGPGAGDEPLDIWLCGGGDLAAQLVDEIDEFRFKINPVLFGDGLPVVAGGFDPRALRCRRTIVFESGVVYTEYENTR